MKTVDLVSNPAGRTVVRRIKSGDFARLNEILNSAFQKEVEIVGLDSDRLMNFKKYHRIIEPLYRIFDFFNVDYPTILVAVINGKVIGEVHLIPLRNGVWTFDSLATDPEYTKLGAGYNLIKTAIEYTTRKHAKKALSSIRTDNTPALKIAEKLGFQPYQKSLVLYHQITPTSEVTNSPNVIIRKFQPTDASEAFKIMAETDPTKTQAYEMTPENLKTAFLDNVINRALHAHSERLIAETQSKMTGYANVTYTSPKEAARIEALCATSGEDKQTVTEALLNHIFKVLLEKNITKITITIDEKRQDTIEILQKLGFRLIASFHEISKQLN